MRSATAAMTKRNVSTAATPSSTPPLPRRTGTEAGATAATAGTAGAACRRRVTGDASRTARASVSCAAAGATTRSTFSDAMPAGQTATMPIRGYDSRASATASTLISASKTTTEGRVTRRRRSTSSGVEARPTTR